MWRLYELLPSEAANGIVIAWRNGIRSERLRIKVWNVFSTRWHHMMRLNQGQWPPTWTTQLVGYPGIYEMRLKVSQHQYRPLFVFGPGQAQITFVFMADEVGDEFVPRDAPNRAEHARTEVMNGECEIRELEIE